MRRSYRPCERGDPDRSDRLKRRLRSLEVLEKVEDRRGEKSAGEEKPAWAAVAAGPTAAPLSRWGPPSSLNPPPRCFPTPRA